MKIVSVSYQKVKNLGNYESERAEATVELNEGDSVIEAIKLAKDTVSLTLGELTESDKSGETLEKAFEELPW